MPKHRRELIKKLRATDSPVEQDEIKLQIDALEEVMFEPKWKGRVGKEK